MSRLEFSIEKLIEEVKKRKCLYDTSIPEYRDKKVKEREWDEVCREVCKTNTMIPEWDELGESEKTDFYFEVKRKWTSLRDCFKRELRMLDKNEHKKRKYYFFDALLFLEPFKSRQSETVPVEYENLMDNEINIKQEYVTYDSESEEFVKNPLEDMVETDINTAIGTQDEYEGETSQNESTHTFNINEQTEFKEVETIVLEKLKRKRDPKSEVEKKKKKIEYGEEVSDKTERNKEVESKCQEFDDDHAFLKSLLPTFREMNTEQKFQLRIEIMKTILKFKQENKT